jgi:FMN phosphatase YigB (HAD superfamily)
MKRQTIAFDLYGTLVPDCGEFSCVRTGGVARLLYKRSLRRDAHALLRSLIAGGNRVIVYSTTTQSAKRLKAWFWLMGIPVTRVITKAEHEKRLRKQGVEVFGFKAPHLFGIDLLIDDCPHTVEAVKESGTNAILVTNQEPDWTLKVRTACRLNQVAYRAEQQQTA